MNEKKKFKLKAPNTYLLIFSLLILLAALTWIIPGGQYERAVICGREGAVQNSLMPQLKYLSGVSRQTAILAFKLGEYTNVIIPTSAVTMGVLSMAKVPWGNGQSGLSHCK
jgi:uncharacterized ion transporter superfamily protein YfcC